MLFGIPTAAYAIVVLVGFLCYVLNGPESHHEDTYRG